VDDFAIKYFSKYDNNHLFAALQDKITITIDCYLDFYLGMTIFGTMEKDILTLKDQNRFPRHCTRSPQYARHAWTAPVYFKKTKYTIHSTPHA